ncbi:MAG: putative membrane protein [Candidatus Methanohalarchaeum thermophilum]|uniref:Membrane protein n=1 Tax=Methanohalarchaeum thermophilum TaxID=1903181 RepID=A0A1Q6DTP7_METT1|nr:MAG: putative membrane protein [Candidatus Methanohalarchaeum thermophilum]
MDFKLNERSQEVKSLLTLKLLFPFLLAGIYILIIYIFLPWRTLIPLMGVYFVPPLGKESVIPTGVALGLNPTLIAFSIAFVDIVVGLFLVWNFDLLKKIPFMGDYINFAEKKGKRLIKEKSWFRSFTLIGLVFLVMVPFQGSGAVTASIIGRMIGIKPYQTWMSIITGSILGCFLIAYFTDTVLYLFQKDIFLGLIFGFIGILLFLFIYFAFWKKS